MGAVALHILRLWTRRRGGGLGADMLSCNHRTLTTTMQAGELGELVKVLPVGRIPRMCHTVMPDDVSSVKFVCGALVGGRMSIRGRRGS